MSLVLGIFIVLSLNLLAASRGWGERLLFFTLAAGAIHWLFTLWT